MDKPRFEEIKNGRKEIETRAATIKFVPIAAGDALVFVCGKSKTAKHVKKKWHFKSPTAMLKKLPLKRIMPDVKTFTQVRARYASYPGYEEKIKKYGLFAFELE